MTAEGKRLEEAREQQVPRRMWGPYLNERQWGTVREDGLAGELGRAAGGTEVAPRPAARGASRRRR